MRKLPLPALPPLSSADSSPAKKPETALATIRATLDITIDQAAGSIPGANCANSSLKL